MSRENRRFRRESVTVEVYYENKKNLAVGGCIVKNISEGGVCVRICAFFPVGTILDLQFKMPMTHESIKVKGKIMWINKAPYNEEWNVGLEMLEDRHYRKSLNNTSI